MIGPLKRLRASVMANTALADWWQLHYGKDARHFIGYKRNPTANDYPSICYVPVKSKVGEQPFDTHLVSLVIGVNEPGMTDDVFDGFAHLDEVARMLVPILQAGSTDWSVENGLVTVTTDMGMRHPFYEIELQFNLIAHYDPIDESTLGDFITFHGDYDLEPFAGGAEHGKWLQEPPDNSTSAPDMTDVTVLQQ